MNAAMRIAAPLALAATAAVAATGFTYAQREGTPQGSSLTHPYAATNATESMAAPAAAAAPVAQPYPQRRLEITAPRLSEDELLRNAVMDRLASDGLGGKVGVEAYRHTVSLTGRVTTTGQVTRAESLARSVDGVWRVDNYLLARVGMS